MLSKKYFYHFIFFVFCIFYANGQDNFFKPEEVVVTFFPGDNYMQIIEYHISYPAASEAKLSENVVLLKEKIAQAAFAKYKYNFKYFTSGEEELLKDGKYIKTQYDMLTNTDKPLDAFTDVLSTICGTPVETSIDKNGVRFKINNPNLKIARSNAESVYKSDTGFLLLWPNRIKKFEIIFQFNIDDHKPIPSKMIEDTKSAPLTEKQVNLIRYGSPPLEPMEQAFQDDADIMRLRHLKAYVDLIEKYKQLTGHYPFQTNSTKPTYILIANSFQKEYIPDDNSQEFTFIDVREFFKEVDSVLKTKTYQLYDPQLAPSGRPIFYIYMIKNDQYYFAIHVSKFYPFSAKISDNYYKIQVSNIPDMQNYIYGYKEVFDNTEYIEETGKHFPKEGFFLDREKQYSADTAY